MIEKRHKEVKQKKAAMTIKKRYGKDWFRKIGKKGGHATAGIDWATRGVIKGPRKRKN